MADQQPAAAAPEPTKAPEFVPLPVPVDMTSVVVGLQTKLEKERELILRALNDAQLIRDFNMFNRLVAGLQASIRSIDTLIGRTDILGQPIKRQTTNVDPAPKEEPARTGKVKRTKIRKPEQDLPIAQ